MSISKHENVIISEENAVDIIKILETILSGLYYCEGKKNDELFTEKSNRNQDKNRFGITQPTICAGYQRGADWPNPIIKVRNNEECIDMFSVGDTVQYSEDPLVSGLKTLKNKLIFTTLIFQWSRIL